MKKILSTVSYCLMACFLITGCSKSDEEMEMQGLSKEDTLAKHDVQTKYYTAEFGELNNSGVSGMAEISLFKNELTVTIHAEGMVPDRAHAQHIHGFSENNGNSTCPTMADDTNGDGTLTLAEGVPSYGGVLLPLTPFPVADEDGMISYTMTFTMEDQVEPLQNRAIVLHGGFTADGVYDGFLPVACSQIKVMNKGKR